MIYQYLLLVLLVGMSALGFWRGWLREIGLTAGLLIVWLLLIVAGTGALGFVNRAYLTVRFVLAGGVDARQPDLLLQSLRARPLVDPRHPEVFLGIAFVVLAGTMFAATHRFIAPAGSRSAQLLGLLIGLANGYLVAYFAFHYFAPSAHIRLPLAMAVTDVADVLGANLATILIVGVVIAIAIALLSSRGSSAKSGPRPAATRSKG